MHIVRLPADQRLIRLLIVFVISFFVAFAPIVQLPVLAAPPAQALTNAVPPTQALTNAVLPAAMQVLQVSETASVSRGEFLRAAMKVLEMPLEKGRRTLPYKGVSSVLRAYVQTADTMGALSAFGKNLQLSKAITRGEAIVLLMKLQSVTPADTKTAKNFSDVRGEDMTNAVALALEKNWLRAQSEKQFGVGQILKGKEAILLLQRIIRVPATANPGSIKITIPITGKSQRTLPKEDILRAVYQMLSEDYLHPEKLDATKAMQKSIQSFVGSLNDPYTVYMPLSSAQNFQNQLKGELEGIGATIEQTGGSIIIVSPLRSSPAERAGLLPKDQILMVDDVSTAGLSLDEAVSKIRGPKGTTVKLHIRREGGELDVSVVREKITIPEVEITMQEGIAIVKLLQFGQTTDTALRVKMKDLQSQNVKGIILDLRNNPGGLLHAAGVVSGFFLPKGSAYVTIRARDETHSEFTEEDPIVTTTPVVVLVNAGSASASEIVAGALKDAKRARIVGEKTFGKGTVQQVVQFTDGSSLKMTIAEWRTPNGNVIDGAGVMPDEVVKQDQGARDDQMLRALEILR